MRDQLRLLRLLIDGVEADPCRVLFLHQQEPWPGGHQFELVLSFKDVRQRVRRELTELRATGSADNATHSNSRVLAVEWLTEWPDCEDREAPVDCLINRVDRVVVDSDREEVVVTGIASPRVSI